MSDGPFLVPLEFIGAAIERGKAHLRRETNPVRRRELEDLIYYASSKGSHVAVEKLWSLGPAADQRRAQENAAWAYWTSTQGHKGHTASSVASHQSSHYQTQRYAEVLELYNSLMHGDPKAPRTILVELARAHGLFAKEIAAIEEQAAREAFHSEYHKLEAYRQKWKQGKQDYIRAEISTFHRI
jgi:hypothetical protein